MVPILSTALQQQRPSSGRRSKFCSRAKHLMIMPAGSKSYIFHIPRLKLAIGRLIFSTESYGGHYGPAFVTYFNEQNAKIAQGTLKAETIVVSALLINE